MSSFPKKLLSGYASFRASKLLSHQQRYKVLAEAGQRPDTMVISCCDSRVAPEIIFDAAPGQLFVLRNIANLVPPFDPDGSFHGTSAAIEYGVRGLRVSHVVVLGHGRCGGVNAFLSTTTKGGHFTEKWVSLLEPASRKTKEKKRITSDASMRGTDVSIEVVLSGDRMGLLMDLTSAICSSGCSIKRADIGEKNIFFLEHVTGGYEQVKSLLQKVSAIPNVSSVEVFNPEEDGFDKQKELELESIESSITNLLTFPIVKDLVEIGVLDVHGAWFDIATGQMLSFDRHAKTWREMV